MSPTLNVNPTLSVIPRNFFGRIIILQCCNYCWLQSDFSPKFESFIHDNISSQVVDSKKFGFWQNTDERIHHPWQYSFVRLFIRSFIQKVTIVTYNTIWHWIWDLVQLSITHDVSCMLAMRPVKNSDIGKCVQNIKRRSMGRSRRLHDEAFCRTRLQLWFRHRPTPRPPSPAMILL